MSEARTITVVGAGNGGFNLVAHLGAGGHAMRLHDIDDAKLAELRAAGGVDTSGMGTGFAKLALATTDLAAAVKGADVIVVCTGGHRQAAAAKALGARAGRRTDRPARARQYGRVLGVSPRPGSGRLPRPDRPRRDGQLSLFGAEARPGEDPADRHQALAADRELSGQPDRRGVRHAGAAVSDRRAGGDRRLNRLHQRQRDAPCRELRVERDTDRAWRGL